jgi:hypothetical protein
MRPILSSISIFKSVIRLYVPLSGNYFKVVFILQCRSTNDPDANGALATVPTLHQRIRRT